MKYNKAQIECIEKHSNHYNSPAALKEFLEAFTAIDPAPDPKLYKVTRYVVVEGKNVRDWDICDLTLEQAKGELRSLLNNCIKRDAISIRFIEDDALIYTYPFGTVSKYLIKEQK